MRRFKLVILGLLFFFSFQGVARELYPNEQGLVHSRSCPEGSTDDLNSRAAQAAKLAEDMERKVASENQVYESLDSLSDGARTMGTQIRTNHEMGLKARTTERMLRECARLRGG